MKAWLNSSPFSALLAPKQKTPARLQFTSLRKTGTCLSCTCHQCSLTQWRCVGPLLLVSSAPLIMLLLLDVACVHDGAVHDLRREPEGLALHHGHRQKLEPETTNTKG